MSKSRGTFITAESYLKQGLNPEWLRYYYAAKLNETMEDIDLILDDFVARVNSDLVGKYVNIASRAAGFIAKHFGGQLGTVQVQHFDYQTLQNGAATIAEYYDGRQYGRAIRDVMMVADRVNAYFDGMKPWELAKDAAKKPLLHEVCSTTIDMFRLLTLYLKPVLPKLAAEVERFLNIAPLQWADAKSTLAPGHRIDDYRHLMTRVEAKQITALVDANKESLKPAAPAAQPHSQQRHAEHQIGHPSPSGRGAGGEGKKRHLPDELLAYARKLRHEQSDAERLMWELLRDRRLCNAKFRRQHPVQVGNQKYILDFYCDEAKLAVELDGGQHQQQPGRDERRTAALATVGIKVVRFWNNDVLQQTESVLEKLWSELDKYG